MELLQTVCVVTQQKQTVGDGDRLQLAMRTALADVQLICSRLGLTCRKVEYSHLEYGSTKALQDFFNSDVAIVDMTIKAQRLTLLHQMKVRTSMGLLGNVALLWHSGAEDTESVRSMLSESDRLVAYTVAAASPTGSVGTGPSGRRHCIVLPDGAGGGGGRLYGRLKRLVKEQRRSALARRQAAYLAEVRAALNQRMRPGELRARLAGMRERLDDPDLLSTEVLLTTLLAYRKAQDYSGMVTLIEHVGEQYNSSEGVQYYYAFALNRRNLPGDRQRALQVASAALEAADRPVPSLLALLGRIYKDLFTDSDCQDKETLSLSLHWYRQAFQAQPNEFSGINLATMLLAAGEGESQELQHVAMVINGMLGRRGSVETLTDYWLVASFFEVSVLTENYPKACQAAACMHRLEPPLWHLRLTLDKVALIHRFRQPKPTRLFTFWLDYFREMAADSPSLDDEAEEESLVELEAAPTAEFLALLAETESDEWPVRVLVRRGWLSVHGVSESIEVATESSSDVDAKSGGQFRLNLSEDQVRQVCLAQRHRRAAFVFTLCDDLRLLFSNRPARSAFYAAVAAHLPGVARGAEPGLRSGGFEPVLNFDYELTPSGQRRELGRGSFGIVYSAIELKRQMKIAVKEISEDRVPHVQALHEEIRLQSRLHHRNIVGLLGSVSEAGVVKIFMEQVPGGSLTALIKRVGALREDTTAHYSHQILQGLHYLHENRIVHRRHQVGQYPC
ncbi:hypothetical protein BOX15_Mlig014523g2 [Macrostomum lignano]|uniref:Protein kinase domain-containing protein n=1 Tax=Macrostomum lignano TaxID=282301 RepID=A0A267FJJ0_9PLAT|nr:hypothetical protein BOX15_Mlig014523g2 [Macrostomum lignano]